MIRVGLFGATGVGKSKWLASHIECVPTTPTLGIDIYSHRFDHHTMLWFDTSGREEYDFNVFQELSNVDAAIFMYDVSSRNTFAEALVWMNRFLSKGAKPCALIGFPNEHRVIGNADVNLATVPWVRQGVHIWFDEVEKDTFRNVLRFFIKSTSSCENTLY